MLCTRVHSVHYNIIADGACQDPKLAIFEGRIQKWTSQWIRMMGTDELLFSSTTDVYKKPEPLLSEFVVAFGGAVLSRTTNSTGST